MASQGSQNSQGSNKSNKAVAQSQPLFIQHKYHQIHLLQKPNNHGVLLEQNGFPEVAHALIDVLNNHFLNTALTKI